MKFHFLGAVILLGTVLTALSAEDQIKSRAEADALVATLKFEQGTIPLHSNLVTLNVPPDMRFLNGHDSGIVLHKLWHNPPQPDPIGMLVPAECDLLADCWAVIITYEEDGYVKDGDAEKINYSNLLQQMQKDIRAANKKRESEGYPSMELVGWATPPRYDRATHKLYWAKDLKFNGETEDTLNYSIRILGRRGVLVVNAIAAMPQLHEIEQASPKILAAIDFNPGNRYADFSEASGDKIAAYGIGALIAGGVAAKVGLFKGLWILALGAKKFIIIGFAAIAAWVRKFFANRKAAALVKPSP
jgi:uncharacterized membrane-anchored protein